MITANKIVYNIKNIASSGPSSDDFRISNRQILHWYNGVRSMLISQAIQKRQDLTDEWIQTIPCIDLEQVDKSTCSDITTDCYILKSVLAIPQTVETDYNNSLISVTGMDGNPLSKINQFRANNIQYNKYTGNRNGWYTKDTFLYIINNEELTNVSGNGLFDDPTELENFYSDGKPCFSWDDRYPVTAKMDSMIVDIVVKTKVMPYLLQFPQDVTNDGMNLTNQQGK
jgi:hypothetical protein